MTGPLFVMAATYIGGILFAVVRAFVVHTRQLRLEKKIRYSELHQGTEQADQEWSNLWKI